MMSGVTRDFFFFHVMGEFCSGETEGKWICQVIGCEDGGGVAAVAQTLSGFL